MVVARDAHVHAAPGGVGVVAGHEHAAAVGPEGAGAGELHVVGLIFLIEVVVHDVAAAGQDHGVGLDLVGGSVDALGGEAADLPVLNGEVGHRGVGDDLDAVLVAHEVVDDLHAVLAADLEVAGREHRHHGVADGAEANADLDHAVHGLARGVEDVLDERHVGVVVGAVGLQQAVGVVLQALLIGGMGAGDLVGAPGVLDVGLLGVDAAAGDGRAAAGVAHALADQDALALLGGHPSGHEAGGAGTGDGNVDGLLDNLGAGLGGHVAAEDGGVAAGVHHGLLHGAHDGGARDGGAGHGVNVEALGLNDALGHDGHGMLADDAALLVVEHAHLGDGAVGDHGEHVDGAVHARALRDIGAVGRRGAGCRSGLLVGAGLGGSVAGGGAQGDGGSRRGEECAAVKGGGTHGFLPSVVRIVSGSAGICCAGPNNRGATGP